MPGIVICGEGPTDLYYDKQTNSRGPLKVCVDNLLESFWDDVSYVDFVQVSRGDLEATDKGKPEKKTAVVRGLKKNFANAAYVSKCAKLLAEKAKVFAKANEDDWGVIFFKDLDASSGTDIDKVYNAMFSAMEDGFETANFETGVPMVPKTRSESWILCALCPKDASKNDFFEKLPMSDKSPNSGKKVLAKILNVDEDESYKIVGERVESFLWEQIQAPSFIVFKDKLYNMSSKILGRR